MNFLLNAGSILCMLFLYDVINLMVLVPEPA